jgi:3-dehydroquinate synthase
VSAADVATFELAQPRGVTRHLAGRGALGAAADLLAAELGGRTVFAVSTRPILDLHGGRLEPLRALARSFHRLEVPDGERAKTVAEAGRLWRRMAAAGGKRDSVVVAFGGGSVGDLAGFAAGGFLRGVAWLALPTTLLAQVDAAIGGKTGVDLPEAKNAVGLFHPPRAVVADADLLATLPRREVRSGLVEVIKGAALLDLALLERVESDLAALLAGDPAVLAPVVAAAARAKAGLVERDPEEAGDRRLLNFGHTLGHALEAEVGYGRMLHGDAVAHGLRFALRLSVARGGDAAFARRLLGLLDRLGVPPLPPLSAGALLARIARDKKAREAGLAWVLAEGPGRGRVEERLPADWVRGELESWFGAAGEESL